MPRQKAVPKQRAVHRFHEVSTVPQVTETFGPRQENEEDEEEYSNESLIDESYAALLNEKPVGQLSPRWSIWPNHCLKGLINLCRTDISSCSHTDSYQLLVLKINLKLHVSALEELRQAEQLCIFCRENYLFIESAIGSSFENFSCYALYPLSFIRALKRDVDTGVLCLKIVGHDSTGFSIAASINCKQGIVTYLTPSVLKWLLDSSITYKDNEGHNSSTSSISICHPIVGNPSWYTRNQATFDSDAFLDAASACSSMTNCNSSLGSGEDGHFLLADELRKGGLTTELRPYQLKGVKWLFDTLDETHLESDSQKRFNLFIKESSFISGRHDGWVPLQKRQKFPHSDTSGNYEPCCLWYNLITEELTTILPALPVSKVKGAVLADEMGIGKSVQVLSLILLMKLRKAKQQPGKRSAELVGVTIEQGHAIERESPVCSEDHSDSLELPHVEDDNTTPPISILEQHDHKAKKRKLSKTATTIHNAMAKKAKKEAKLLEFPCVCGRRYEKKGDLGWVECDTCNRWQHVRCCGFSDAEEAKSQKSFMCLACSCIRYGSSSTSTSTSTSGSEKCIETENIAVDDDGRIRSNATLIIMPSTLIAQWRSEVAKHIAGSFNLFDSISKSASSSTSISTSTSKSTSTSTSTPSDLTTLDDVNLFAAATGAGCALRVFVFDGCEEANLRSKGLSFSDVDPRTLASKYDIIIMSLKTLTKDFHKTQVKEGVEPRVLRARSSRASSDVTAVAAAADARDETDTSKMYVSFPPPIMCIRFAMVVVDETQKIESEGMPQGLSLCTRIAADRRLCVTGTPLGHNRLSDLHSLCQFLQLPPYSLSSHHEWLRIFGDGSNASPHFSLSAHLLKNEKVRNQWLTNIFSTIMLRRTKNMLGDQLGLLPTVTSITMLTFSGFEAALYSEKLRSIAREVSMLIADTDIGDAKMKLEILRKGCCHPQVWDKDLSRRKGTGQGLVARPFDEIMILKVEQSRLACEERQRELVYHLNSLAGVAMLEAQLIITGQSKAQAHSQGRAQANAQSDVHSSEVYGAAEWDSEINRESNGLQIYESPGQSQPNRLCASDHLLRALRAYAYAYSFLERNRQTCPVLGLVRISGTPEGSFRVLRAKSNEEHAEQGQEQEQDGNDLHENLLNVELRADQLSFSWSGTGLTYSLPLAGAIDDDVIVSQDHTVLTDTPLSSPLIQENDHERMSCVTANNVNKSSTTTQTSLTPLNTLKGVHPVSVHTLKLFSPDRSRDIPVCAKMAFGAGRRLQQLKIQTKLPSLMAVMRLNKRHQGGRDVRAVLLFPQRVSLLAASGIADAFTRVACFDLALPTLTFSSSTGASSSFQIDDIFQLNSNATFSDETVCDFPLSFRARSWKLDVLSVHGICFEVKLSTQTSPLNHKEGHSIVEMDVEENEVKVGQRAVPAIEGRAPSFTGRWRRTLDCLSSLKSSSKRVKEASVHMSIDLDLFEATFDVDAFQELHICANIPLVAGMLHEEQRAKQGKGPGTNRQEVGDSVTSQLDEFVAFVELEKLISIPSNLQSPPLSPCAIHPGIDYHNGDYGSNNPSNGSSSTSCSSALQTTEIIDDCETPALFQSPSSTADRPLLPKSLFPVQRVDGNGNGNGNGRVLMQSKGSESSSKRIADDLSSSTPCTSLLLEVMRKRANQIEKDFVAGAQAMCASALYKMEETITASNRCEEEILLALDPSADLSISSMSPSPHRKWWVPLLLRMEGERGLSSLLALQCTIDQGQDAYNRFKHCTNVRGLIMLVGVEFEELQTARSKAMQSLRQLSSMPTANEILRASDCQRCRVYFKKTGPVCAHCRLEDVIVAYRLKLVAFKSRRKIIVSLARPIAGKGKGAGVAISTKSNKKGSSKDKDKEKGAGNGHVLGHGGVEDEGDVQAQEFNSEQVDGAFSMIVKHIRAYAVRHAVSKGAGSSDTGPLDDGMMLKNAAIAECRRCEGLWKELLAMTGLWQRYMSLLKVHDEVDQGKRRIGLNEYGTSNNDIMSENNLFSFELSARYNEDYIHALDKSTALKQSVGQLNFYKNQEYEARQRLAVVHKQRQRFIREKQLGEQSRGVERGSFDSAGSANQIITAESRNDTLEMEKKCNGRSGNDGLTCVFCQEDLCSPNTTSSSSSSSSFSNSTASMLSTNQDNTSGSSDVINEILRATAAVMEAVVCLPCAHSFHRNCVKRWLQIHKACPVCKSVAALDNCVTVDTTDRRSTVSPRKLSHPNSIIRTQSEVIDNADVDDIIEIEQVQGLGLGGGLLQGEGSDVEINGQWGCKIDALVHDLLRLLLKSGDRGDGDKAIVFSQWTEMIDIVSEALTANNILFSICANRGKDFADGGTLERFKSDIDIRVLLMPLHLGAEGLDLIQASHIFLLEPLLNPALESQAVNRIHRIGQSKKTHVHKFAIKGTVEELILKGQQSLNRIEDAAPENRRKSKVSNQKDQDFLTLKYIRFLLGVSDSVA